MMTDAQLYFSDGQALSATADGTNVHDSSAIREIGAGEPVGIAILITVAATTNDNDETYVAEVVSDDDEALGSASIIAKLTMARADMVAGALFVIPLSSNNLKAFDRYVGMRYTLGGTTPAVTLKAWVTPLSMVAGRNKAYPSGFEVG